MPSTFKTPVRCTKHERCDPLLGQEVNIHPGLPSIDKPITYVVGVHENLLQLLVRLPYSLAVVLVQRAECLNLVMQMLCQRLGKGFDQRSQFRTVVGFGIAGLAVLLELLKSRGKGAMLFHVALHQSRHTCDRLDVRKEILLFGIVMMVHRLAPALTVCQEVADRCEICLWDVRRLDVDRVQPSKDAIVGQRHLGGNIVGAMRRLPRHSTRSATADDHGISNGTHTSFENASVEIRGYGWSAHFVGGMLLSEDFRASWARRASAFL
jgi:hypothetical protein